MAGRRGKERQNEEGGRKEMSGKKRRKTAAPTTYTEDVGYFDTAGEGPMTPIGDHCNCFYSAAMQLPLQQVA